MISFDRDRKDVERTVSTQIRRGNLVGHAAAHSPDFELHNFAVSELAEVAARIDEAHRPRFAQ
jgi:hypothetical protein